MCGPARRTIYNMCTQKPPHDYSEALYDRYKQAFSLYIDEKASRCLFTLPLCVAQLLCSCALR